MTEPTERRRQAQLIGLLTFASGGIDVVTLMVIGGSFTSVITGNLIFIGRAIGTSSLSPALHAIMAVAGYVAGVAVGSRLRQLLSRRAPPTRTPTSLISNRRTPMLSPQRITRTGWRSYAAKPSG